MAHTTAAAFDHLHKMGTVERAMLDRLTNSVLRNSGFTTAFNAMRDACLRMKMRLQQECLQFQLHKIQEAAGQIPSDQIRLQTF